ncbi:MAG: MarR family winged helix-turn-helix transcriptional regulator [Oscillospiraceae bacterium]
MLQKDVGYLIKNINDKLKVRADADLKRYDLTLAQSRVLAYLNACGGEATQKELEVFLEVSHPTVVGIVSRMEQKGYLTCRMDESNKRNKLVRLTDKAKALGKEMEQNIVKNEKAMLSSLSDSEIEQLKHALMTIYGNL